MENVNYDSNGWFQINAPFGTRSFIKFCPACKLGNDANSITCVHCGKPLDLIFTSSIKNTLQRKFQYAIPAKGLAIYFLGNATPIAIATDKEVILGRKMAGEEKGVVDLAYSEGYAMGVSRHHAKIRSTTSGYELIDLNSSNGTWLEGKVLTPTESYDLPSGAIIQLGRLKLVTTYKSAQ